MKLHGLFFQPPLKDNYFGHILEEVYKSNIYAPYMPKEKGICVEIGANVGLVSYYLSDYFNTIYSIEPASDHFETLNFMLNYNDIKNVKTFQYAVSNKDGEQDFYHYPNRTMYSLTPNLQAVQEVEKVKTIRLDTFFKENKIEHCEFLKLDCEGEEFNILGGDGFGNVADKIDLIIGEVHGWGDRNPQQLFESLKNRGFKVETLPNDATIFLARK